MELTISEITTLVFQHSKLAMQLRKSADEHDKLAQVYLEVGKRFNREVEEKESKMKLRNIMTSILMLVLVAVLMGSSLRPTVAQDVSEATAVVTASVNGNPVEATLEPVHQPAEPVDQTSSILNVILDKLITIGAIIGLIVLAYKTAGLVPKETFDSALEKGFDLAKGITSVTPTSIDDTVLELVKPGLTKWLDDEFAKRAAVPNALNLTLTQPTVTVPPMTKTDFTVHGNG